MAKSRNYMIRMPEEGYQALKLIAKQERRVLADVMREAFELYTKSKGVEATFEVDRGGYRPRKTKKNGTESE